MSVYYIFLAFLLVLLNGLFVAAEFSLVKLRNTQVALSKNKFGFRGRILSTIHKSQDVYLSACQVGITMASLALGWIGEPAFVQIIYPFFKHPELLSPEVSAWIATTLGFIIIAFLHIVIGEIAPKSLSIRKTEIIALWTAVPIYYFYWIMYPIIYSLNKSSLFILSLCGIQTNTQLNTNYSKEEIKLILNSNTTLTESSGKSNILENSFTFSQLTIADIMHPIDELSYLQHTQPLKETVAIMINNKYSRYPIFNKTNNSFDGIIHIKDVFSYFSNQAMPNILPTNIIRPILTVPYNLPVQKMFSLFNQEHSHFAIITNKINETIGFITLDNIISILLGNINDEFNHIKTNWIQLSNGAFLMKGSTPLYSLEKLLNISFNIPNINTISGLITNQTQQIPKEKDIIELDKVSIIVRKMRGPHIILVKIIPKT